MVCFVRCGCPGHESSESCVGGVLEGARRREEEDSNDVGHETHHGRDTLGIYPAKYELHSSNLFYLACTYPRSRSWEDASTSWILCVMLIYYCEVAKKKSLRKRRGGQHQHYRW